MRIISHHQGATALGLKGLSSFPKARFFKVLSHFPSSVVFKAWPLWSSQRPEAPVLLGYSLEMQIGSPSSDLL